MLLCFFYLTTPGNVHKKCSYSRPRSTDGLSTGTTVSVVLGCVAAAVIAVAGVAFKRRKHKEARGVELMEEQGTTPNDRVPYAC